MTHDELLEKIAFDTAHHLREALRAIVELHKSVGNNDYCAECHPDKLGFYPCFTIQVVEDNLNG